MKAQVIQIPWEVYENVISHLKVHESTDAWAKVCLSQLQTEAKPIPFLPSGSYLRSDTQSWEKSQLN